MHEGQTLGDLMMGYDYDQSITLDGESFVEFPLVAGSRELPEVIATGQTVTLASKYAGTGAFVGSNSETSGSKPVNTLSVYDGRSAGVGRIVTGSTFHHYVDINLTGDSSIDTALEATRTGPGSHKNEGFAFAGAESTFADIKAVFVNITEWLARPKPALGLILERSTFSQDEALATPDFEGAILITVDGLNPSQFPGGGIDQPRARQLRPELGADHHPAEPTGLTIEPTWVDSDDPGLNDRLQRFTFTYKVTLTNAAFGFGPDFNTVQVDASLPSPAVAAALTDRP